MDMNEENKCGENSGGQEWRWCLVGNIVGAHEFGEEHEIRYGTKHFSVGTKVYVYPEFPGMGNENIVVIGIPRNKRDFIEVVVRRRSVENFRCKKVFGPAVLKRMDNSKYSWWWGNSEEDRNRIIQCVHYFNEDIRNADKPDSSEGLGGKSEENKRASESDRAAESKRTAESKSTVSEERESGFWNGIKGMPGLARKAFENVFEFFEYILKALTKVPPNSIVRSTEDLWRISEESKEKLR